MNRRITKKIKENKVINESSFPFFDDEIYEKAMADLQSGNEIDNSYTYAKNYVDEFYKNVEPYEKFDWFKDHYSIGNLPDEVYERIVYDFARNNDEPIFDYLEENYSDSELEHLIYDKIGLADGMKKEMIEYMEDGVDNAIDDFKYQNESKRYNKKKRMIKESFGYDDDDLEIVNPNDMNYCDKAWIVGVWSGVGYYVNRFLAFANNEGDALNETINYLVEKGYNRLVMSYDELYDEVKKFEDIDDGGEWSEEVDELIYRDYASNDDGTYFVRFENLIVEGIDIGIAKEIANETLSESKKKTIKRYGE